LSFKIVNSPTLLLPAWKQACAAAGLTPRMLPRPVATRWNSTFDMLYIAIKYRTAIDAITGDRSLKLRALELSDDNWRIIADLLDIFKKQTIYFSQDTVATVPNVLLSMRKIALMLDSSFSRGADQVPLHPSVHAALDNAVALMNRYQSYTNDSDIYRVVMGAYDFRSRCPL
ncbi:hypothetical protein EV121DRAFT_205810, partial [Schizophyllum commune]